MKFAASFAVMALLNNLSSVECSKMMDDDLFTDDGEVSATMSSMKQAEKAHNTKFIGLNRDGQDEVIKEKSAMTFSGDEFVKNDPKHFDKSFVQIDDSYPEPRPIGEVLSMIGSLDFDEVKTSAMISRTADQDRAILAGSSLNDDEDEQTTLESLKSAEKMSGAKFDKVESKKENFARTGSFIHNFLEDDHRIYTAEVDNALADKGEQDKKANAEKKAQQQKQALMQQQAKANQVIE